MTMVVARERGDVLDIWRVSASIKLSQSEKALEKPISVWSLHYRLLEEGGGGGRKRGVDSDSRRMCTEPQMMGQDWCR